MSDWFLVIFVYSLAGCALEKVYARAVRSPKQVRKCFLLLPLCPVYGIAMAVLLALGQGSDGFVVLALRGAVVCTAVEYLVHLFYDKVFHVQFWDYTSMPGSIRGRICPQFALAWGLLSAAAVLWVQPAVAVIAALTPRWLTFALWMTLAADCVLTTALLRQYHDPDVLTLGTLLTQARASSQSSTSL